MLDMLTTIPDTAILPCHSQQPPATFTANMDFRLRGGCCNNAIGGILSQFGDKRRWPRMRSEKRQGILGPGHGDIHDAPFFRVLKCLFLRCPSQIHRYIVAAFLTVCQIFGLSRCSVAFASETI